MGRIKSVRQTMSLTSLTFKHLRCNCEITFLPQCIDLMPTFGIGLLAVYFGYLSRPLRSI